MLTDGCAEPEPATILSESYLSATGTLTSTTGEVGPFLASIPDKTKIVHARIDATYSPDAFDLTPLSACRNLRSLTMLGVDIATLSPLARLQHVEKLSLDDCSMSSWQSLSGLTSLRFLRLSNCNIVDLKPISKLTHLKELGIAGMYPIDIEPILELPSITHLVLITGDIMFNDAQQRRIIK